MKKTTDYKGCGAQSAEAVEYADCIYEEGQTYSNELPGYDTKQSDADVLVMLWRTQSTSSLPLLPGPHWPGVVAPDRDLLMGQIQLIDI